MTFAYRAVLALGLLITLAPTSPASAQGDDERAQARAAFERGVAAYSAERWEEALHAFQEAYRIAPHPSVRVNMANAYLHLGRPVEALDHFERFLIEIADEGDPAQKREVRQQITELRGQVGEVFVRVQPEGATVTLDGHTTRRAPILDAIKLAAGTHHVEVSMDGYRTHEEEFQVEGGGRVQLRVELEEGAPLPAGGEGATGLGVVEGQVEGEVVLEEEPEPEGPSRSWEMPTSAWIGAGATVALGATAVVLGIVAIGADSDFDDAVVRSTDPSLSPAERAQARQEGLDAASRADRLALTADILGIAAVAAAGATVFLFFWGQDDEDGVAVAPAVSPTRAGLSLTGSF